MFQLSAKVDVGMLITCSAKVGFYKSLQESKLDSKIWTTRSKTSKMLSPTTKAAATVNLRSMSELTAIFK